MFEHDFLFSERRESIWYVVERAGRIVAEIKKQTPLGKPKVTVYGNDETARSVANLSRGYVTDRSIEVHEYGPNNYIKRSFFGISREVKPKGTYCGVFSFTHKVREHVL